MLARSAGNGSEAQPRRLGATYRRAGAHPATAAAGIAPLRIIPLAG